MRATRVGDRVTVELDPDETRRLAAILTEGTLGHSRAEFFIRTGGSQPQVQDVANQLYAVGAGTLDGFETALAAGVEGDENPRRPRPRL